MFIRASLQIALALMSDPVFAGDGAPMSMAEWQQLSRADRTEVVAMLTKLMFPKRPVMAQFGFAVQINECLLGFAKPAKGSSKRESEKLNVQVTVVEMAAVCARAVSR